MIFELQSSGILNATGVKQLDYICQGGLPQAVDIKVKPLYVRADYDDGDEPTGYELILDDNRTNTIYGVNKYYAKL